MVSLPPTSRTLLCPMPLPEHYDLQTNTCWSCLQQKRGPGVTALSRRRAPSCGTLCPSILDLPSQLGPLNPSSKLICLPLLLTVPDFYVLNCSWFLHISPVLLLVCVLFCIACLCFFCCSFIALLFFLFSIFHALPVQHFGQPLAVVNVLYK